MKLKKLSAALLSCAMLGVPMGTMPVQMQTAITAQAAASDFTAEQGAQWGRDRVSEGWCEDVDGAYGCQCVDLIQAYGSYLGVHVPSLNAYQYETWGLPDGWTKTYGSPAPGDIFVMGATADNQWGHVGMVTGVNGSEVTTAETNYWSDHYGNPNCREVKRDVSRFTCFIHPNFKSPTPQGHVMSEDEAAGQTIPDGDYYIFSGLGEKWYVDIDGDDIVTENGVNVQEWGCEKGLPGKYDVWTITYRGNGFYKIKQKGGKLCLDARGGTTDENLNINLWEDIDSNAQQWSIEKSSIGYRLQVRCNSYYLDIEHAETDNGINISTCSTRDTLNQRFCFVPYEATEQPLKDGVYRISSMDFPDKVLDVSGVVSDKLYTDESNVQVWDTDGDDYFRIEYDKDGYYHVYEYVTDLSLDIYNSDVDYTKTGNNIQLCSTGSEQRNQLWKIRDAGNGAYYVISQLNGYYMDMERPEGKKPTNGTNVSTCTYNGGKNQMWIFTPYEEPTEPTTEEITEAPTTEAPATEPSTTEPLTEPTTEEKIPDTPPATEPPVSDLLYGDTTDDGVVDIMDVITLNQYLLGSGSMTNTGKKNADVNGDMLLDTTDSLNILKLVVEILTPEDFPLI